MYKKIKIKINKPEEIEKQFGKQEHVENIDIA